MASLDKPRVGSLTSRALSGLLGIRKTLVSPVPRWTLQLEDACHSSGVLVFLYRG